MNKARLLGFGILTLVGLVIAPFWLSPTVPPSMQTDAMKKAQIAKEEGQNPKTEPVKTETNKTTEQTTQPQLALTSYQNQDHEGNALPVLEGGEKAQNAQNTQKAEKAEPLVYSREPVVNVPKNTGLERPTIAKPAQIDNPAPVRETVKKKEEPKKEVVKKETPKKPEVKKAEPKKEVAKKPEPKKPEPKKEVVKKEPVKKPEPQPKKEVVRETRREAPVPVEKGARKPAPRLELTSIRSTPPTQQERRNANERRVAEATREAQRAKVVSPKPTPASKSNKSSYLQVGAFAKKANADNVANYLRRNGFSVSLRNEQGLTKVFVGPVPENQIKSMQQRLARAGHESRRVN